MRRFSVTLYKGSMNMGGMRANLAYMHSVTVSDDEDETVAIARAREEVAASEWSDYAKGRAEAVEMFRWAITLRSDKDKRRRETFIVVAQNEKAAYRNLGHVSAANRFAGYNFGPRTKRGGVTVEDERVVKIERKEYR